MWGAATPHAKALQELMGREDIGVVQDPHTPCREHLQRALDLSLQRLSLGIRESQRPVHLLPNLERGTRPLEIRPERLFALAWSQALMGQASLPDARKPEHRHDLVILQRLRDLLNRAISALQHLLSSWGLMARLNVHNASR